MGLEEKKKEVRLLQVPLLLRESEEERGRGGEVSSRGEEETVTWRRRQRLSVNNTRPDVHRTDRTEQRGEE